MICVLSGTFIFPRSVFIYVYCVWGCMYIIYLNIHVFFIAVLFGGLVLCILHFYIVYLIVVLFIGVEFISLCF